MFLRTFYYIFLFGICGIPTIAEDDIQQYEFPARPAPAWVRLVDQGVRNRELAGLMTPEGIKVELFATNPAVVDPVGMAFAPDGTPYVLEWRQSPEKINSFYEFTYQDGSKGRVDRIYKEVDDQLKRLLDTDADGVFETSEVVMDDLQCPSSLLIHDGWFYFPSNGWVIRRRQSKPNGPFDIEEEIVHGLCGFDHHQSSGVTLSHDGWLFVPAGDNDNRGEGSDGSRATVLRTGAIFRMRPDGSHLQEFARGFRNPYRDVQFDHFYNMFHVDNDQEDGSKFQGVRLMHIAEGADYGWRLYPEAICCQSDFVRGAVFGEKPGKMPSMLKTGRGAPAGLLIYQGTAFPEFFRGLLIYPDVYRKLVRAYEIEQQGSTFRVKREFVLMQSDDDLFRPCQAVVGPDGAIYIVDWRTPSGGAGRVWGDNTHGRIYRLTWSGIENTPAIQAGSLKDWKNLIEGDQSTLWQTLLSTDDFEQRRRAQMELVKRSADDPSKFVSVAIDTQQQPAARAAALGGAAQLYDSSVKSALIKILADEHAQLRRLACETLSRNVLAKDVDEPLLAALVEKLQDHDPAVRRSAALATGELAAKLPTGDLARLQVAEKIAQAIKQDDQQDVYHFDGMLRGLERLGADGLEQLEKWLAAADQGLQQRAVYCLQCLRTKEGADLLDRLLDEGAINHLSPAQQSRIISTYRDFVLDPPVQAAAITRWMAKQKRLPLEVQLACMETLGAVPGGDQQVMTELAEQLLQNPQQEIRSAVIRSIGDTDLKSLCPQLISVLKDHSKEDHERRTALEALSKLRSYEMWPRGRTSPGVELVLDDLVEVAIADTSHAIQSEALELLAEIDFRKAKPIAQALLNTGDLDAQVTAIRVLGSNKEYAVGIAEQFLAGGLDRQLLPQVAEALRRHQPRDKTGELSALLARVFKGGLLVKITPEEIAKVEQIVRTTGNPEKGKEIFFDRRSQCFQCHKIERVGNQVGPDLTKIWETHTIAKIMESIVDPSKEVKEGFSTWTVVTDEGLVYNGLKIKDDDQEVVIRDTSGREIRIPADTIEDIVESKTSLMPEGVVAQLSYQEFIDLVAFLKSKETQQQMREENQP